MESRAVRGPHAGRRRCIRGPPRVADEHRDVSRARSRRGTDPMTGNESLSRYEHVLAFALEHPWAVMPSMLTIIATILARRIAGEDVTRAEIEAALVNR